LDDIGWYESEADFYNGPGRNPGVRVPRAYFAAYQPEPLRYVSVIENITDATGRLSFDDVTLSDLTAVVRTMAQLHAYWWGSKALSPYVGESKFYDAARMETGFSEWWPASREFAVEHMPANAVEAGDLLLGNVERVLGPLLSKTPTLRHGDFHVGNVLFLDGQNGSDGPDTIVIDWQTWSPGDPSIDLSTLMLKSVRFENREEYESVLLDVYLSELSMRGVNDYSMDELLVDYRRSMAFMLVRLAYLLAEFGIPGLNSDDPDLRETMGRRARTWAQDYGGAIRDHDLLGLLRDEL
jgi:aminoglycoside phosphotransferase (APT) family kinase protein